MDTLTVDVGQYLPFLIAVVLTQLAAHVHHGQDIVAGVLIAAVAVGVTTAAWAWVRPRLTGQRAELATV